MREAILLFILALPGFASARPQASQLDSGGGHSGSVSSDKQSVSPAAGIQDASAKGGGSSSSPSVLSADPGDVRLGEQIHVTLSKDAIAQLRGADHEHPIVLVLNGNVMNDLVGMEEDRPGEGD